MLPMQGAWVPSLVRELDPICRDKRPLCHNKDQRSQVPQPRPDAAKLINIFQKNQSCLEHFQSGILKKIKSKQIYKQNTNRSIKTNKIQVNIEFDSPHSSGTLVDLFGISGVCTIIGTDGLFSYHFLLLKVLQNFS